MIQGATKKGYVIYLANKNITERWTMPIKDWNTCISQFVIFFGDRVELELVRELVNTIF